ncbi:hypothetical protein BDQ12DRAFT_664898 [Crucibulum laeve]|uniref:Ferric oxidoreductase domain-containing protein n=1 Tax=Crucibulum laeve TaxID=68775 RepID=A0A5C3M389_9AGAR|nr:hypothetical protein BDQ12DRAFT_664898 [Crucibulum laeve]
MKNKWYYECCSPLLQKAKFRRSGGVLVIPTTGWILMAILPFLLDFTTKFNLIGLFAGVPHEKLQVYHQWLAWIMYITSLIHTFPFIISNIKHGTMELNYWTKSYYWTGIAALVPQLHCNFCLTSWDYIWASAGVYFFPWFACVGLTLIHNGMGQKVMLELLPNHMVKNRPLRVILDGPYSGVHGSLCMFDHTVLLAGSSGASFTVLLLLDLVQGLKENMTCDQGLS